MMKVLDEILQQCGFIGTLIISGPDPDMSNSMMTMVFQMGKTVMSTLSLYTYISLFSMIYNVCMTFGTIIQLGQYCRMCFEPLAIYAMSFRPFPMISNDFMEFSMFAHLYLTYHYINGLSMHSPYYSIPI
jgi:hypothetical protein